MNRLIAAAAAALFTTVTFADEQGPTVAEYSGTCGAKVSRNGATVEFTDPCKVTIAPDTSRRFAYFNVQLKQTDRPIVIRVWNGGLLTVDNVPAMRNKTKDGTVYLTTAEGQQIRFPGPPKQFAF
jgi:hypothetical protein